MPAKHSPALLASVALGLSFGLTACGPIAFTDSINYAAAAPEPDPEPPPATSHATLTEDHIVLDGKIQFGYDSAELDPSASELLDDVVKILEDHPEIEQIDVIGHTSTEGSAKHNKQLSTDRAASVADYLANRGIDRARLMSEGKGEDEPIADESVEGGKEKNRRVEFKIVKKKESARAVPGA